MRQQTPLIRKPSRLAPSAAYLLSPCSSLTSRLGPPFPRHRRASFDMGARSHILSNIVQQHGSVARFTRLLKLRFLLQPLRYDADVAALVGRSNDLFDFSGLVRELETRGTEPTGGAPRSALACVCASSGEARHAATSTGRMSRRLCCRPVCSVLTRSSNQLARLHIIRIPRLPLRFPL